VDETMARATHSSGRWQRAPGDPRLDGALLLAAIRGAVPADDPLSRRTLDAYVRELTGGRVRLPVPSRRPPARPGRRSVPALRLPHRTATFQQGDRAQALRWFERNRAACGPAGLLTEEYDVGQRQLRGNLPQAFVHALLLECAARLTDDDLAGGSMRG
jgi:GH15 family glucan-1,4-alpha-glucosidase